MNSRFIVAIAGGVGAGKKKLVKDLSALLGTKIHPEKFLVSQSLSFPKNSDYKIFLDQPSDALLQKYVLSIPQNDLSNKKVLEGKMEEFRKFYHCHVMPNKYSADFYVNHSYGEERIHKLTLEILAAFKRKQEDGWNATEPADVQVYLDKYGSDSHHPSRVK